MEVIKKQGFTLVEVLLAMAVASVLLVTLLSILSKSIDVSKQTSSRMFSKSSAQASLDVMETDLNSLAVNRNVGQVLLFTNTNMTVGKTSITNAMLYCLSASMEDSYSTNYSGNPGSPRLIQYSIQYTTNFASSSKSVMLCRDVLEPTNTFLNVLSSSNSLDSSWATYAINTDPSTNMPNTYNNELVPNVVGMSFSLYTNYGEGVWTNSMGSTNTSIYSTNFPQGLVLEIALTVLDDSVMERFTHASASGNNSATNLIKQYGRTLVRRVSFPSPP